MGSCIWGKDTTSVYRFAVLSKRKMRVSMNVSMNMSMSIVFMKMGHPDTSLWANTCMVVGCEGDDKVTSSKHVVSFLPHLLLTPKSFYSCLSFAISSSS